MAFLSESFSVRVSLSGLGKNILSRLHPQSVLNSGSWRFGGLSANRVMGLGLQGCIKHDGPS